MAFEGIHLTRTTFLDRDLCENSIWNSRKLIFYLTIKIKSVCKLIKSPRSLKQSPRKLHVKLDSVILRNRFSHNSADKYIYSKCIKDSRVTICVYVDNMLIIGTNLEGTV